MSANTIEALGERLAVARGMLSDALLDSRSTALEHGARGLQSAREFGTDAWQGARRGSLAAGSAMSRHPWETLLLAGVAGVAIGWIARHAWRGSPAPATTARKPRAGAPAAPRRKR